MQRLLLIAGSALVLTACSSMEGMTKHHPSPYADLAKIAKQEDAQFAMLLTRDAKLVVVNVATGKLVPPEEVGMNSSKDSDKQHGHDATAEKGPLMSDADFAALQRKFDSTITIKATRGSVCMQFAKQPPGHQYKVCSPPAPQWW